MAVGKVVEQAALHVAGGANHGNRAAVVGSGRFQNAVDHLVQVDVVGRSLINNDNLELLTEGLVLLLLVGVHAKEVDDAPVRQGARQFRFVEPTLHALLAVDGLQHVLPENAFGRGTGQGHIKTRDAGVLVRVTQQH